MRHKKLLFGLLFSIILGFAFNGANAQSQEEWIALGPDNVSGRSRAIIFDRFNPNVLYSGGVAGGLFISVNNGKNWQEISLSSDNQANLAITAIAQDNNGVIYLGTGESNYESAGFGINNDKIGMLGNGVYRLQTAEGFNKEWATNLTSDDAKYDWAKTNIKFQLLDFTKPSAPYNYGDGKSFINRIAVNEITNKVYVATQAGLMLLEQDSWSEVNNLTSVVKVGDIVFNSNGVAAVYFNDSEAKVAVSNDDFASDFRVIYKVDSLKNFEPAIMSIDRIRLAFGNNYPNRLFVYNSYVADAGEGYITRNLMLVRTNDINEVLWRRTTPQSYINGQDYTSMAMAVNDYVEPEQIYLGGYYVYRGYDANESDIYYWEQMSRYTNSQNSTNGIRTSDEYVSSGMNEIILKKNPLNYVDSTMIVVASSAGIHIYSYDSVLAYTAWRLSTKNMNTTQFYSVAVTPDASIVGGTVDNGSVFIANSGELGVNKSGDVLWTANSEGYNPNKFQLTTDGGMVAASQFQRLLPSQRKSLILSRPYGQIARTYSNEGDYSLIDDVTWQFGSALFDSITLTDGIENDQFKNDAPTVTPLLLWESTSSTLPDTMNLSIDKNTVVNFIYDSTWREGSWINAGDSVLARSPNMEYPFTYVFPEDYQYNQDTVIRILNPIQSRLFFITTKGLYVCSNINDYMASPLGGSITPISMVRLYDTKKFANVPTENLHCLAITDDGKTLFVSADKVGAVADTSFLYRFDLSSFDWQHSSNAIAMTPEILTFPRKISSIAVDKHNGNNVILTFGTYLSANSNVQVSSNALAQPFTDALFQETINIDDINGEDFLPNNKPVFCALIESVNPDNEGKNVAYIGAEDGIYKTENYLGEASTGGKLNVNWVKMEGIPNVPIFQLVQQNMRLPRYEFYNTVAQNTYFTTFEATQLPGAIYAASYGKGLFAYLGDTIEMNNQTIGIKDNAILSNLQESLRIYPNPANVSASLNYTINKASDVLLQIYDMNGRLISSFSQGRKARGNYSVDINVQNLKSGIYMVRVVTNNSIQRAKLIVQ